MIEFDNLTYLHGKPQGTGLLKANPEDFVVVEDLGFEPDGEGEHILVRVLKNGCNTRFVADALAKFLKIHAREVSFAGQKDKHAVTELHAVTNGIAAASTHRTFSLRLNYCPHAPGD